MTKILIYLEFDKEDVFDADVYNYLQELMDNNMLDYIEVEEEEL